MSGAIHQPHDKLFKLSMSQLQVAKDFFIKHLPAELLQELDLETLELHKETFIDEAYKATEADVVYSVKLKGSNNLTTYLYLLCEQQTEIDQNIVFRLLSYTVRIIEMHRRQHSHDLLPLVYPLVIYTGEKIWDAPLEIYSLFGQYESLAREWLFKPYQLIDVARMSDEELRSHDWCGLIEFVLKYRQVQDLTAFLETILPWMQSLEVHNIAGLFIGRIVLQYVTNNLSAEDIDLFEQKVEKYLYNQLRGEAMTLAEAYEQRGIAKGMQQGMQQGEAAVITRLLERRFGKISQQYMQRINLADADTLLLWADRLLNVKTLDEVFAGITA